MIRALVVCLCSCGSLAAASCGGEARSDDTADHADDDAPDAVEVTPDEVAPDDGAREETDDGADPDLAWRDVLTGLPEGLRDLWASGPYDLWVVGDAGLAAHGGPEGWRQLDLREVDPEAGALRGVFGPDDAHVWMVGDGGRVFRWTRASGRAERVTILDVPDLRAVWGASEEAMWVVGGRAYPEDAAPVVLRVTPDGAVAQALPEDLPIGVRLLDVWGSGPSDVWAVGESGLVLRWNGLAWTRVTLTALERLTAVTGADGGVAIVGGTFGAVLAERRGDAAFVETWPPMSALEGVAYAPDGALWAVGVLGRRAVRPAGATEWTDLTDPGSAAWQDVWVDARGDVWVVAGGLEGRVARYGPERGDVATGPLVRVDDRPDPDPEPEPDGEIVETVDVEIVETVDEVDETEVVQDWPFVIGALTIDNVFTPLVDGQTMPLVHGPQGGFHIEVAVRFPWAGGEPEVVAGLRLGLFIDGSRQAVYETSGYPFASIGDGLYQTFIVPVMFDCIFTAAACSSADFDGRVARLDIAVEPPGRAWSGSIALLLEDTW